MGRPLPAKLATLRKEAIMRFGFFVALFMCLAGADLAWSSTASDAYFAQNVKPQIEAYNACAVQHLINLARIEPNRPFDEIEITLKPACGFYIDRIKEALERIGFTPSQSNNFIRNIYRGGVAVYLSAYEREAIAELGRRRAAQAVEAERQQAARAAELQRQQAARTAETERQQASEADAERKKVFQAAVDEHLACLRKQMVEIVPYSNESAETLAGVITTKCAEFEQKRVSFGMALYGVGRADSERLTKEAVENVKKQVVAEIVSLRADQTKAMMSAPKSADSPKATTPSGGGI